MDEQEGIMNGWVNITIKVFIAICLLLIASFTIYSIIDGFNLKDALRSDGGKYYNLVVSINAINVSLFLIELFLVVTLITNLFGVQHTHEVTICWFIVLTVELLCFFIFIAIEKAWTANMLNSINTSSNSIDSALDSLQNILEAMTTGSMIGEYTKNVFYPLITTSLIGTSISVLLSYRSNQMNTREDRYHKEQLVLINKIKDVENLLYTKELETKYNGLISQLQDKDKKE